MDDKDISIFSEEASEMVCNIKNRADFNGNYEHICNDVSINKLELYDQYGDVQSNPTKIKIVIVFEERD